jgi:hypothetical protein
MSVFVQPANGLEATVEIYTTDDTTNPVASFVACQWPFTATGPGRVFVKQLSSRLGWHIAVPTCLASPNYNLPGLVLTTIGLG